MSLGYGEPLETDICVQGLAHGHVFAGRQENTSNGEMSGAEKLSRYRTLGKAPSEPCTQAWTHSSDVG